MVGFVRFSAPWPPSLALDWLAGTVPGIRSALSDAGAVLISGLPVGSVADVARVRDVIMDTPMTPTESFAPRQALGYDLFSPIRWPSDRTLCPHHEESYSLRSPGLLLLACLRMPTGGGEPLLTDSRDMLRRLPATLVGRLRSHGWLLTRTFRDRIGTSWREAFHVQEVVTVEDLLCRNSISFEWLPGGGLRTTRTRPAVVCHPGTGDECWFNDAGFLNEWSLDPAEREVLLAAFGSEGVPVNTAVGDRSPLVTSDVLGIEKTYEELAVPVTWRAGDVLLLDNILVAHGRRPYTGKREVVVALGDPIDFLGSSASMHTPSSA
jgi:hypothetical protein